MLTKIKNSYHTYAFITIVFWAMAFAITRLILQYFSAFALGFLRYFIASCVLALLVLAMKARPPRRADWSAFAAAGASGFFIYVTFFNKGCLTVPAATSSLIVATTPMITSLLARVIYKEKLSRLKWLASFVELLGVALLTVLNGVLELNAGVWWLLGGVFSFSVYNILQRHLNHNYSALQTSSYSIFAGTLMLAIFLPSAVPQVQNAPPSYLLYLIILGVFPSAIAFVTWSQALAKAEQTASVSNYMFLTPALASLFAFWLLGEQPAASDLWGGSLILLGMALFNFGDKLLSRKRVSAKAR